MVGGGSDTTEATRSPVARGRPNWWVILAVSLALMALLVATAGSSPRTTRHGRALASAAAANRSGRSAGAGGGAARSPRTVPETATTTTTTTTTAPSSPVSGVGVGASGRSPLSTPVFGAGVSTPPTAAPVVTTTTAATTTTTSGSASVPADRTQAQGYLDPPLQTSNGFGFTGTGATQVSALWSGATYLTMEVSCPNGSQSVGGTTAMAASLPDARGSCLATVTEPAPESTALTYTITIGPAGG